MFNNIGEKIKVLAVVVTILGIIVSIVVAIIDIVNDFIVEGVLILVFGSVGSWIGSFVLYGFGELICKTNQIAENTKKQSELAVAEAIEKSDLPQDSDSRVTMAALKNQIITDSVNESAEKIENENIPLPDECPLCFTKVSPEDEECPYCGYPLKK